MVAKNDIVTFDELHGYVIVRRLGYVSAIAARPRNRLRATFRSLGMLIGMAASEFLSDAEHLRAEALNALVARAESLGANAVIAAQFHVSESVDGACKVVAFGEAVLVAPESP